MNGKRYVTVTVHQAWFFAQGRVQKITVARGIDKKEKWFQSTPDELAPLPTDAANPYRPAPAVFYKIVCQTPDKVERAGGESHARDLETGGVAEGF